MYVLNTIYMIFWKNTTEYQLTLKIANTIETCSNLAIIVTIFPKLDNGQCDRYLLKLLACVTHSFKVTQCVRYVLKFQKCDRILFKLCKCDKHLLKFLNIRSLICICFNLSAGYLLWLRICDRHLLKTSRFS